jgi:acid phosphatase
VPSAAAEGYAARTGTAATYTTSAAAYGSASILFSGSARTYFDDTHLTTATGQLVWSAPIRLPSLPAAGGMDTFLVVRSGTNPLATVDVSPTGAVQIRNGANTVVATSSTRLGTGNWYTADVSDQGGVATVRLFSGIGATLLETIGPVAVTAGVPNGLRTGLRSSSGPLLIDQVTVAQDWVTPLPAPTPGPCGGLAGDYDPAHPPVYKHVVVIMEENLSYTTWQKSAQTPYTHALAAACGSETNYHGATHPSQPNYMAVSSGVASHVGAFTTNENIFHQVQVSGGTWRDYAESMTSACQATETGTYKPGHTPAYWYQDLRTPTNTCAQDDVPMSPALDNAISADSLPTFAWISPNECNGFYHVSACSDSASQTIPDGDAWLKTMMGRLTAMPSYQQGQTLIVVTWDEGDVGNEINGIDCTSAANASLSDCHMPTFVVSPYISPGETDSSAQNHYTLGGTIADILGQARVGREVGAGSLRSGMTF